MPEDYEVSLRRRVSASARVGDEDCPNRVKFLAELEAKRGWVASDWRTVLGIKASPELGQNAPQK